MSKYTSETQVKVCSFARRTEGDEVTIGDLRRQVFLTIPTDALVILDGLAEGQTVAQARDCYQERYGDAPDIEDFLEALESAGFVSVATEGDEVAPDPTGEPTPTLRWLSPARARRLCQPAAVVACGVLVATALVLVATDPATIPSPAVLVFKHYLAPLTVAMFVFAMAGVAVHELAHLAAARAAGVDSRIGVSHRLWIAVAETDMTGIWLAPKRARYLAFLAGPLVDAASAAVLVGVVWGQRHGLIALTPIELQVVGACLLLYLLRLLWQCFFFVRTDFYFVVAAAFNCGNLMVDTQNFLHNRVARVLPSWRAIDQSGVPEGEMRVVRWYAAFWLVGRAAAFFSLFAVVLPVTWQYIVALVPLLLGGHSRYGVVDGLVFGLVSLSVQGLGLVMWVWSLFRWVIERKSHAMATG